MITRRKLLKLTLASLVIPALRSTKTRAAFLSPSPRLKAALVASAQPCPTLVLDGAQIEISHPWEQIPGLLAGVRTIRPQAVGYPGHHLADYWDWQTGWVDTPRLQYALGVPGDIIKLMTNPLCVNLDDLSMVCAETGAPAFFTANLLSRNPRLSSPGSADPLADAAAGKAFLLDGLRACAARGVTPRWLALGDSLAGEQPWQNSPAETVFRGDPVSGFTEYPQVALNWAAAARQYDPGLAVAAFAVGNIQTAEPAVTQWNRRLVQQLAGQAHIRALAFSLRFQGGMGISTGTNSAWGSSTQQKQQYALLKDPQALRALFSKPTTALQDWLNQPVGDGRAMRESGLRFWLNALYMVDPIGTLRFTWAHGLLLANALRSMLGEPAIDLVVMHNTSDPYHAAFFQQNPFLPLKLDASDGVDKPLLETCVQSGAHTALGQVFGLFLAAQSGAATAQPLAIAGDPLVWGRVFLDRNARPRSVLLGNLTETGQVIDLSTVWASAGGVMGGQVYQAAPCEYILRTSAQAGMPFALQVNGAEVGDNGVLSLPPYSLALLSGLRSQNPVFLPLIQKYN